MRFLFCAYFSPQKMLISQMKQQIINIVQAMTILGTEKSMLSVVPFQPHPQSTHTHTIVQYAK